MPCAQSPEPRADGDPASDYLLGTQVFLPFDLKLPAAKQQELISVVRDANKSGYAIRVALIGSAYDLDAVTSHKRRLLIVMPNGFGFN